MKGPTRVCSAALFAALTTNGGCGLAFSLQPLTTQPSLSRAVSSPTRQRRLRTDPLTVRWGWLDNFLPKPDPEADAARRTEFPEQYPATYELSDVVLDSDDTLASLVRPLLKQTQLECRPLRTAYDASRDGWNPSAFHDRVDGAGAAVVVAMTTDGRVVGGYNPKGWASMGGARPSVAAFLFYGDSSSSPDGGRKMQKLRKVGGGGLACAGDDPGFGISFGPDSLVVPFQSGRERLVQSKLGPYYERGPEGLSSLFDGASSDLVGLHVLVGVYDTGEEIPYSGAVLDMTSG